MSHTLITKSTFGWPIQGVTTNPGVVLRKDFLIPMEISANHLVLHTRMPATRIGKIPHGRRGFTSDTALRLARYFGTSAEFWLNLQASCDLSKARHETGKEILKEIQPLTLEAVSA